MSVAEGVNAQQDETLLLVATGARETKINIPQAMALMRDVSVELSELADFLGVTENTVRNLFNRLESHKILRSESGEVRLTGFGHMVAREQQHALDELKATMLSKFASSEAWPAILRALRTEPLHGNELADTCDISRRTRREVCNNFVQRDWVAYKDGQYQLLPLGESKLSVYEGFKDAMTLISQKKDFVLRLDDLAQEFPTAALRETDMATGTLSEPHAVLTLLEEESDTDAGSLRGVQQVFSPQFVEEYDSLIPEGKEIELVIDKSVFRKATKVRNLHYLRRAHKFDNFHTLIHPENLSVGFGIFGDERALVGAYSEEEPYNAAIVGSNEVLVDWVTQKYEEVRKESQTPTERFWSWLFPG
ncbi:hypothetical protein [Halococcus sp. PRR34]|uniref:transcriptional regulator FilR1 domain-containing protein n=1 Tax=Halococcus sp. PRR34 TaxID=3020830 RepID=UPI00235EE5EB|nr:hypothetical protein [Halococcus sp. PRR34]